MESKKENKRADEQDRRERIGLTLDPGWRAAARAALARRCAEIEPRLLGNKVRAMGR